jgi:hypothetical protein
MQNVLSALMALLLIALVATGTASDRASAGQAGRVTFSDDTSLRPDVTADAGAFIEPPLTAARTAERPVESASVPAETCKETRQPQNQPSLSDSPFSIPWALASSSVRRACLHVYRL